MLAGSIADSKLSAISTAGKVALTDVKTYLNSAGFVTDDPTALAIALG